MLTALQERVARIVAALAEARGFALAGGGALVVHGLTERVHRHFRTLRRVLNVAVEHELLARSPCAGLSGPRVEATEMRFLNAGEVQRVAEELPPQFRTLVYTAAYTGMRWGELIGLRRALVDLAAPAITVVEQLVILDGQWPR